MSERIERVHAAASSLKLPFLILSGRFGLIQPEQRIPAYDHLLKSQEVPALIELVLGQVPPLGIDRFVYCTKPLASSTNLRPCHDTIVGACRRMSLPFLTVELEDWDMSTWRTIMEAADAAKIDMISDRVAGEKKFEILLKQYPRDGMIYFKRGEAYEAVDENALALTDFQRAMALFPKPDWKARAKEAADRVKAGLSG
jgi:tetratricopeptide (TPR) repeat protein